MWRKRKCWRKAIITLRLFLWSCVSRDWDHHDRRVIDTAVIERIEVRDLRHVVQTDTTKFLRLWIHLGPGEQCSAARRAGHRIQLDWRVCAWLCRRPEDEL